MYLNFLLAVLKTALLSVFFRPINLPASIHPAKGMLPLYVLTSVAAHGPGVSAIFQVAFVSWFIFHRKSAIGYVLLFTSLGADSINIGLQVLRMLIDPAGGLLPWDILLRLTGFWGVAAALVLFNRMRG